MFQITSGTLRPPSQSGTLRLLESCLFPYLRGQSRQLSLLSFGWDYIILLEMCTWDQCPGNCCNYYGTCPQDYYSWSSSSWYITCTMFPTKPLELWMIILMAVGGAVVLGLIIFLSIYCYRRRKRLSLGKVAKGIGSAAKLGSALTKGTGLGKASLGGVSLGGALGSIGSIGSKGGSIGLGQESMQEPLPQGVAGMLTHTSSQPPIMFSQ